MIHTNKGFTLMEMMVVVIIVGILAAMATAYYGRFLERMRTAEVIQLFGTTLAAQERLLLKRQRYTKQWNVLDVSPMGTYDVVIDLNYANADKTHYYTNGSGGNSSFRPGYDVYFEDIGGKWFMVADRIGWGGWKYSFVREFDDPIAYCVPEAGNVNSESMCADFMGVSDASELPPDPRNALRAEQQADQQEGD